MGEVLHCTEVKYVHHVGSQKQSEPAELPVSNELTSTRDSRDSLLERAARAGLNSAQTLKRWLVRRLPSLPSGDSHPLEIGCAMPTGLTDQTRTMWVGCRGEADRRPPHIWTDVIGQ
jgi:hypothetical protein